MVAVEKLFCGLFFLLTRNWLHIEGLQFHLRSKAKLLRGGFCENCFSGNENPMVR